MQGGIYIYNPLGTVGWMVCEDEAYTLIIQLSQAYNDKYNKRHSATFIVTHITVILVI